VSTTAPAGPEDVIGRAMVKVGAHIERFLAPVEPGNLMLMGYKNEVPIISAPCCYRSAKSNVLDLLLPPVLAKYRISGWEIACLGHGGYSANSLLHRTQALPQRPGLTSAGCESARLFLAPRGSPFIM